MVATLGIGGFGRVELVKVSFSKIDQCLSVQLLSCVIVKVSILNVLQCTSVQLLSNLYALDSLQLHSGH